MVYYKIPLSGGLNYPAGCILICAYTYNGYEYCKFEKVTEVGSKWVSITESEFNIRCPEFPDPEYTGEMESDEYPGCYYRIVNGEKEWQNPPMVSGQEYRTSERFLNNAVYVTSGTYIGLSSLEKGKSAYLETGIPASAVIVDISGMIIVGDHTARPLIGGTGDGDFCWVCVTTARNINDKPYEFAITSARDYEGTGNILIRYTIKYTKP